VEFPPVDGHLDNGLVAREEWNQVSNSYGKRYAAEFKRDAVVLVKSSPGRTVSGIARELGVSPEGLRGWVKQARVDAGGGTPSSLTSAGREELAALRRRVREQDQVINILKKAAVLFAQDSL
jgi:transposase